MINEWVDPEYLSEEKIGKLQIAFSGNEPFPHLMLPHLFRQEKMISLLQALGNHQFHPKLSDLFQFSQTADLLHTDDKVIKEFAALLSSQEFMGFMQNITKIKLNKKIDLFGSIYQDTDFLLPHDDQFAGRKIAFMLYLNDLEERDGGSLALYGSKNKTPSSIVRRIIPRAGAFVFFEVSELSFHTVEEILNDTQRITLSGWFYG